MRLFHGRLSKTGRLQRNLRELRKFRTYGWPRLYISAPRPGTHNGLWSVRIGRWGWYWGRRP